MVGIGVAELLESICGGSYEFQQGLYREGTVWATTWRVSGDNKVLLDIKRGIEVGEDYDELEGEWMVLVL